MDTSLATRLDEALGVVWLRLRRREHPELSEHDIAVILHVPIGETRSVRWLADHFGMSLTTASEKTKKLEERGYRPFAGPCRESTLACPSRREGPPPLGFVHAPGHRGAVTGT